MDECRLNDSLVVLWRVNRKIAGAEVLVQLYSSDFQYQMEVK